MDTENLISLLASDRTPPRRPLLLLRAAAGATLSLALLLAFWGLRPGWEDVADHPVMLAKLAWPLALAAGAGLLLRSDPGKSVPLWPVAVAAAAVFVPWVVAASAGGAVITDSTVVCLVSVPLLALPIVGTLFWGLRHRVVPAPERSGLIAGLCAGGLGAAIYSLHCHEDAASFFLLWYGVGITICGVLGRVAGPRFLCV